MRSEVCAVEMPRNCLEQEVNESIKLKQHRGEGDRWSKNNIFYFVSLMVTFLTGSIPAERPLGLPGALLSMSNASPTAKNDGVTRPLVSLSRCIRAVALRSALTGTLNPYSLPLL